MAGAGLAGLTLANAASAQSPGCALQLRQANAQGGAARIAALRRVAANCPNDSAGRRAAQLAAAATPPGPSPAELERQRRLAEEQRRERERERQERLAEEQRQRDRDRRIAEEQRQRDRDRRIAEEQRQRERDRQIAEEARRRQQQQQQQQHGQRSTTASGQRPIVAYNRCNVPVRFRLVYSYRGVYSRVDSTDVAWTVEPNDTRTLVYRNIDVTTDNPVMYFHIVSPQWNYPETTRRTFEYGGVNLEMYGTTTSINANGAYQIQFC